MKAKKTKKEIEREIALTGTYVPDFSEGDYILSNKVKNLNKTKKPNILKVLRVIYPIGGGEPSYRLWSELKGKRNSELCSTMDLKYRKLSDLEAAVFLD